MSLRPMLKCAQCETRHQGAFETKRHKKVDVITVCSSTQTEKGKMTRVKASKKEKESEFAPDAVHIEKAKVLTRSQQLQGPKNVTNPSWMEGGICLDREFLREEQLKDFACVDALCWIKNGQRPVREEILSIGIDQKFLWASFDCLVIQDGLLYKEVGPLTDCSGFKTA